LTRTYLHSLVGAKCEVWPRKINIFTHYSIIIII